MSRGLSPTGNRLLHKNGALGVPFEDGFLKNELKLFNPLQRFKPRGITVSEGVLRF